MPEAAGLVSAAHAAYAAQLLQERGATDPLAGYEPLPHARRFAEYEGPEAWIIGGNRCSKSTPLAAGLASALRYGNLNPRPAYSSGGRIVLYDRAVAMWVVSLTFGMSREIIQPKMFDNGHVPPGQHAPFIPAHEIAEDGWNKATQTLRLKSGSFAAYKSADQGVLAFPGVERDVVGFDEAPPKHIYHECVIRIGAGRPLRVRGACTLLPPEGAIGGISWLYSEKIRPWLQAGGDQKRTPRTWDGKLLLIGASIYDNTHLDPEEIARLEAIYPLGSVERAVRLEGAWVPQIVGARAYAAYDGRIHADPQLGPASIDRRRPLLFCYDSNVSPLCAVIAQQQGREYVVLDEIVLESGTVTDLGEAFVRRYPTHGAALRIYGDATAQYARSPTSGRSDYELLLEVFRRLPYPVELSVPERNGAIRDRINAVNFLLKGRGGEVRLRFSATHCPETIADCEIVQRSRDGGILKARDRRDPYFRRTHCMDGVGYMVVMLEPVSVSAAEEYGFGVAGGMPAVIPGPAYRFGDPGAWRGVWPPRMGG